MIMKLTMHRKKATILFSFIIGFLGSQWFIPLAYGAEVIASPKEPDIHADSAILIDGLTGTILYSKNENKQLYPASITKILTGIIALENSDPDEIVTVSKEARYEEGTRVYLGEGEQVPMINLIYGLLMNSGNDAATAIAEHLDGTKEVFSERMNQFVKEKVGVNHTQFRNPHGLYDPGHYTTAYDMAMIAKYAMANTIFREIVATKTKPWNGKEWQSNLVNHNKLLWTYAGSTGIKNGFTDQSRFTLVASAQRDGMEIIGVLMKSASSSETYTGMTQLFDYGFEVYERREIMGENETKVFQSNGSTITFIAKEPVWMTVRKGEKPTIELDAQGNLVAIESTGIKQTIVQLAVVEEQQVVSPSLQSEEVVSARSGWVYAVFLTWLGMNLFLLWLGRAILRRRNRMKS